MKMNKQAKISIILSFTVIAILALAVVAAKPSSLGGGGSLAECRDGIDNDGDGLVDWKQDPGCSSKNDNDETNCGDAVCEGGETASSCAADCSIADSCSDSDGGNVPAVAGSTSGFLNGSAYSNADTCAGTSAVVEYFCSGVYEQSQQQSCGTDSYGTSSYCMNNSVYRDYTDYSCAAGSCGSSTAPVLQETCQYGCTAGACDPSPLQPDLIVSNLTFAEESYFNASTNSTLVRVSVSATVKNIGNGDAGPSNLRIEGLGSDFPSIGPLSAGASASAATTTYDCTAAHMVIATADFFSAVVESDETNNAASTFADCIL